MTAKVCAKPPAAGPCTVGPFSAPSRRAVNDGCWRAAAVFVRLPATTAASSLLAGCGRSFRQSCSLRVWVGGRLVPRGRCPIPNAPLTTQRTKCHPQSPTHHSSVAIACLVPVDSCIESSNRELFPRLGRANQLGPRRRIETQCGPPSVFHFFNGQQHDACQ